MVPDFDYSNIAKNIRTDLYEKMIYLRLPGKEGIVQGIQFPRHFVPKWKFDITWEYISKGILVVNPLAFHSTESLFNNAQVWTKFNPVDRRDFGRCLAYYARDDIRMLPLQCTNPTKNNKLYLVLF